MKKWPFYLNNLSLDLMNYRKLDMSKVFLTFIFPVLGHQGDLLTQPPRPHLPT